MYVAEYADSSRLYPRGDLVLFKLSGAPGRPTSACGAEIYRDELLGADFAGNAFTCEPVNQLVHRLRLSRKGATFSGIWYGSRTQSLATCAVTSPLGSA